MGSAHPHGVSTAPTPHPTLSKEPPQESTLSTAPELLFLLDCKAGAQGREDGGMTCPDGPSEQVSQWSWDEGPSLEPSSSVGLPALLPIHPIHTGALLNRRAVCDSTHI